MKLDYEQSATGARNFARRLADGWYPSGTDSEGQVVHDRHVLIHVRNQAHDLSKAAGEIAALRKALMDCKAVAENGNIDDPVWIMPSLIAWTVSQALGT